MLTFEYSVKNPDFPVAYASFGAMNTILEMVAVIGNESDARSFSQSVYDLVTGIEKKFSRFDDESPVAEINRTAAGSPVAIDGEIYMALQLCEVFREATQGYFDIGYMSGAGRKYVLDPVRHTIRFLHEDVVIDMGGFAKGYALDKVKGILVEAAISKALVNFGNSSTLAVGNHPYGESWPVGVQQRLASGVVSYDLCLCDSSLSVSGRTPAGIEHIKDPVSGEFAVADELIIAEGVSAMIAEVLSTALYAAPTGVKPQILAGFEGYRATSVSCGASWATIVRHI